MRKTSNYYKVYNFNGFPYSSVRALKEAMRLLKVEEINICVDYHRRGSGRLAFCEYQTFRVRIIKDLT